MPDTMKAALTYVIPALPLLIAVMIASIGALPDAGETAVARPHQPRVGMKDRLHNFWHGENTGVSVKIGQPKFVPDDEPESEPSNNGSSPNPTVRQRP